MLTDAQARKIASDWHDGTSSYLYRLASTGSINSHHTAYEAHQAAYGQSPEDMASLFALRDYCQDIGPRGPVKGWASMPQED